MINTRSAGCAQTRIGLGAKLRPSADHVLNGSIICDGFAAQRRELEVGDLRQLADNVYLIEIAQAHFLN